ncbi:MAG: ATP-grasp domain-containing protein [Pseudomonadota bacterium]
MAVELARAFAAAGHPVLLADSVAARDARWSRVGRGRCLRLPAPRDDAGAYRAALRALIDAHRPAWILPTCEEVFHVAAAAAACGFADRVFAPSFGLLRTLHSKIDFPAFARSLGIAAPQTWAIAERADCAALPLPPDALVFKPEFSRFGTSTLIRPSSAALRRIDATAHRRWAAQRHVEGEEICLWTAIRAGRVVASAAYRPRWRLGHAASYAFETVSSPQALRVAETIAGATGLSGQLSFDIVLTADGAAVPIECNPRAVSGVHLFDGDPALADALLGRGSPVHAPPRLRYLAPAMLLFGLPQALRDGRMREFVRDVRRGRDALTRPGDRLPAAGALLDTLGYALRGGATRGSTADIEWNGEPLA